MRRSKTSKAWLHEHVTDRFVRLAKRAGYRSRAAYKLIQLHEREQLFRPGMLVVDLGAAPGGWSQVAAELVGKQGAVIALDLLEMNAVPGVRFIQGDFSHANVLRTLEETLAGRQADLVISDLAPNLSGIAAMDQARSAHLVELVLEFAEHHLQPGGTLLVKCFQGAGYRELLASMRARFRQLVTRKPEASRARSSEMYVLGKGKK
jgi:23S rRNA (uridine2552-2'-O)-methyltransferase